MLARFDTGEPALVERAAGRGRVMVFASTLDLNWNDLALKPMFLPFVHQLGRHLSGFKEQPAWLTIGQVLDVDAAEIAAGATSGSAARAAAGRAILAPSGQRRDLQPPAAAAPGATAAGRRARARPSRAFTKFAARDGTRDRRSSPPATSAWPNRTSIAWTRRSSSPR